MDQTVQQSVKSSKFSRKYIANTSVLAKNTNGFEVTNMNDNNGNSFKEAFQLFTLDLGRTDYPAKWYPTVRILLRIFLSIIACSGVMMLNIDNMDSASAVIISVLDYISLFYVNHANIYIALTICCGLFIAFFALAAYYIYIFRLYMQDECPSSFELNLWLFLYRVILPIFGLICPGTFFSGLFSFFKDVDDRTTYYMQLGFGALFFIFDTILEVSSSVAFNSTPLIRHIDSTQFWFAYSNLDWLQHFIFAFCALLSLFFQLFDLQIASVLYFVCIALFSIFILVFIVQNIPYIRIQLNVYYFALFSATIFAGSLPFFYYYLPKFAGFVVFICIAVFGGAFYVSQRLLLMKCRDVVQKFNNLTEQIGEEEEGNEYKMLHLGLLDDANRNVDYDQLGLKSLTNFSTFLTLGFLFKMPDIENHKFTQYAVENCHKGQIILTACQIELSLQTDMRLLKEFHQEAELCPFQVAGAKSFFRLLNELRQEQLSQLNTPLLDAISKAKRASHRLNIRISDFWGAVLKQKLPILLSLLPEISDEMEATKHKFERLLRNYPQAPVVLRESINFFHKTTGNHRKTVEVQAKFNKNRRQNAGNGSQSPSESQSGNTDFTNNDAVDENFLKQMEPYYTAQDTVLGIKSAPITAFTVLIVLLGLMIIALPTALLVISIYFMSAFQNSFTDVKIFGDATYSISRIPQLVRRKNLFRKGVVSDYMVETGPPIATILEFLDEDSIIPAVQKYIDQIDSMTEQYLQICKTTEFVKELCEAKNYTKKVGLASSLQTGFDLLYSFKTTAETLIAKDSEEWNTMESDAEMRELFENVDEVYRALNDIMHKLDNNVMNKYQSYYKVSTICYAIVWVLPTITIVPLISYAILGLRAELVFTLGLLFTIPKSDISALRWVIKTKTINNGGNHLKKNALTNSESSISGSQLSETKQASIDQFTTTLSTNEKHVGGLFSDFLIKAIIFVLTFCILSTIGTVVYQVSMDSILDGATNYIQAIIISASALASYMWGQELFVTDTYQMRGLFSQELMKKYGYELKMDPTTNKTYDQSRDNEAEIKKMFLEWRQYLKTKTYGYHRSLIDSFDRLLYGLDYDLEENKDATQTTPALFLSAEMVTAYVRAKSFSNVKDNNYTIVNGLLHDVYASMSCESQMRLLDSIAKYFMDPEVIFEPDVRYFLNVEACEIQKSRNFTYHFEHLLFCHLDPFFTEGRDLLYKETDDIGTTKKQIIIFLFTLVYLLDIFMFIGILVPAVFRVRRHQRTLRSLLLLNEPETLLKAPEITKWLSGNHKPTKKGEKAITTALYDEEFIVNASKCGLLLSDMDLKVIDTNSTVANYFKGVTEFHGLNVRELLVNAVVDKDKALFFKAFDKDISKLRKNIPLKSKESLRTSILAANGQVQYVSVKIIGHTADEDDITSPISTISVAINDRTTEYFQEALVESEKKKSEKLVTSLLPPAIVKRMNEGETDISFEVQTATVLFSKVDQWESIMEKMSAFQVVQFLNTLFSGYDEELAKNPVITKLKTIGHIYMIAGGLFSDSSVNHAQIMVNYALNMQKIVENINAQGEPHFKVTIGINTGGPINCGILGVTRPVFDILGDVVNVSSRMNSSCIPGYIQISPGTYEAIKFLGFFIRERGEIQVKGKGLMKTYIVQQKKDDPELNIILKGNAGYKSGAHK